jgi:hypothetical protein
VHLNGTSVEELEKQFRACVSTLNEAMNALYLAAPNARDYYPLGADAFEAARKRHEARIGVVAGVQKECMATLEDLADQAESRRR